MSISDGPGGPPPLRPGILRPQPVQVHVKQSTPALLMMVFIAGFFFVLSGLLLLLLIAVAAFSAKPDAPVPRKVFRERLVRGAPETADKVLLLNVEGLITSESETGLFRERLSMVDSMDRALSQAEEDPSVRAVLLRVNSPGGGITACDVLYRRLVRYREQTGAKVVAMLGDVAASGGYYVAMASDHVVAHPTTLTGSIGVIMPLMSMERLLAMLGIEARPVKSGERKDMAAFYRALPDEERQLLQAMVDEMHERFVEIVWEGAQRRGASGLTREGLREAADGRVFTGREAAALELVSETGYFADALDAAVRLAGVKEAKLVEYVPLRKGIFDFLEGASTWGTPGEITLRVETPAWLNVSGPMYLWSPGLPALARSPGGRD